jgi:hypothetical protein
MYQNVSFLKSHREHKWEDPQVSIILTLAVVFWNTIINTCQICQCYDDIDHDTEKVCMILYNIQYT